MTLLLQLRDAARAEADILRKYHLTKVADELHYAVKVFSDNPTAEVLQKINGLWAHGVRLLDFSTRGGGDSGGSLREGARLAA